MALFWSAITSRYPPATIQEGKVDMGKALDVSLVVTKAVRQNQKKQDTSSRSRNDADVDNENIIPIYDELMAEVQLTGECNILPQDNSILSSLKPFLKFASQVDVNHNFSRPVIQHYLPKRSESAFSKPSHMIASSSSRNSSKNLPRFSSNDMVHNHYLDEARKKTQERDRNSKTSVMPFARFQSTADNRKPKPRSTNHLTRSFLVSKSSCVTKTVVPIANQSKNSKIPNTLFVLHVISASLMQIMMLV
nr:hypothetical protein [Tanacetum cinerariifolium]